MAKKKRSGSDGLTTKGKRIGRPPKAEEDRYRTPQRQLGRIPDEEWDLLRDAAASQGMTFSGWAVKILLREAKKQLGVKPA